MSEVDVVERAYQFVQNAIAENRAYLDEIILRCTPKAAELLKNGLLGAVKVCAVEETIPKTNADRIRGMSDEELASKMRG